MTNPLHKRRFLINAISSSLQSVVVALTLFILYRFLLRTIPVEHIGIWSVIFAAASVGKLAEMGVSAGVVKFVAAWLARNDAVEAAKSVRTAATATTLGIGCCMLAAYFVAPMFMSTLVGSTYADLANSVVGLALLAFWLSSVASVFQAALDGCHRMDFRSGLTIATTLLHFSLCLILTPHWGLYGLGISQVVQSLATLLANQLMLQRVLPEIRWRFWGWHRDHFRELLRYGLNAQLASVSITLLSEPITKAFISSVGGLGFVAYYDMATRMISQLRGVILSAFQAMVPMVSHLNEQGIDEVTALAKRAAQSMLVVALPLFAGIIAFAALISQLWIGHIEHAFVFSTVALSIGWGLNTIVVPAYMINLGTGNLKWNTWSHLVIGALNAGLGYALAHVIGAEGAVLAWAVGLSAGSMVLVVGAQKVYKLNIFNLIQSSVLWTTLSSILLASLLPFWYSWLLQRMNWSSAALICLLVFVLVVLPLLWKSEATQSMRRFVGTHLAKR